LAKLEYSKFGAPSLGHFIRSYLLERGKAYPYEIFRALKKSLLAQGYPKRSSYQNVRNYFRWLRELGLIKEDGTAPSLNPHLSRRSYYTLTSKGLATPPESLEWTDLRRALYPQSWDKHHKKGKQTTMTPWSYERERATSNKRQAAFCFLIFHRIFTYFPEETLRICLLRLCADKRNTLNACLR